MMTAGGFRRERYDGPDRTGLAAYLVATAYGPAPLSARSSRPEEGQVYGGLKAQLERPEQACTTRIWPQTPRPSCTHCARSDLKHPFFRALLARQSALERMCITCAVPDGFEGAKRIADWRMRALPAQT